MGVEDEPDQAGTTPKPTAKPPRPAKSAGDRRDSGPEFGRDVGAALRSVYQKAVEEQVPAEFLDLLGKLG